MVSSRDAASVLVVRDGYVLYWPDRDRTERGSAGYAVRSDDPFIGGQLNKLHVASEGVDPVPPSEWPQRWRQEASRKKGGEEWIVKAERASPTSVGGGKKGR